MDKDFKLLNLFSFPLMFKNLNLNNDKLKDYVLSLKEKNNSQIFSNVGGWHSPFFNFDNSEILNLCNEVLNGCKQFKSVMGFETNIEPNITNMWSIVNENGHFNRPHVHKTVVWSGAYYIQADGDEGDIVFLNPSVNLQYHIENRFKNNYNETTSSIFSIKPETNKLLIFPSWIQHYVNPNLTKKSRIAISFNVALDN
jgi:uncharacterized protein (TIGR02466 family)